MFLAVGFTVALIAGEIDLSFAAVQAFAGTVAALLIITYSVPVVLSVILAITACGLVGFLNGLITTRLRMPSFIVTLAMLGIVQGVAFLITGGRGIRRFPDAFRWIGTGRLGVIPVAAVLGLVVLIALHLAMTNTQFFQRFFAVGGNAEAASHSGIRVSRVKIQAMVMSSTMAGFAGIVLSARLNAGDARFGEADLLVAVAATVIGGTSLFGGVGTVVGSAIGVVIIVSIKNGMVLLNMQDFWQRIVVGLLIIGAVLVDQTLKRKAELRL